VSLRAQQAGIPYSKRAGCRLCPVGGNISNIHATRFGGRASSALSDWAKQGEPFLSVHHPAARQMHCCRIGCERQSQLAPPVRFLRSNVLFIAIQLAGARFGGTPHGPPNNASHVSGAYTQTTSTSAFPFRVSRPPSFCPGTSTARARSALKRSCCREPRRALTAHPFPPFLTELWLQR
jgi:hypothetical protein